MMKLCEASWSVMKLIWHQGDSNQGKSSEGRKHGETEGGGAVANK